MRQAYKDPMNGEDGSWRLIYVGPAGQLIGSLKPPQNLQLPKGGAGLGAVGIDSGHQQHRAAQWIFRVRLIFRVRFLWIVGANSGSSAGAAPGLAQAITYRRRGQHYSAWSAAERSNARQMLKEARRMAVNPGSLVRVASQHRRMDRNPLLQSASSDAMSTPQAITPTSTLQSSAEILLE